MNLSTGMYVKSLVPSLARYEIEKFFDPPSAVSESIRLFKCRVGLSAMAEEYLRAFAKNPDDGVKRSGHAFIPNNIQIHKNTGSSASIILGLIPLYRWTGSRERSETIERYTSIGRYLDGFNPEMISPATGVNSGGMSAPEDNVGNLMNTCIEKTHLLAA